jgi:sugar/nucleoside kinase (ribokinase family)
VFYNDHKHVVQKEVAGVRVEHVRDTTGCGDVFGAALHLQYVRTRNLLDAAQFANNVASARTRFIGIEGLRASKDNQIPIEG